MRARVLTALSVVLALCALLVAPACGPKLPPGISPEGRVAVYGRQFVIAADGVLTQVDQLMSGTPPILSRDTGLAVIRGIRQIGVGAKSLAAALTVVDEAKTTADRTNALTSAASALRALQKMVTDVIIPIPDSTSRQNVAALLSSLSDLLLTIALALPPASTAPGLEPVSSVNPILEVWGQALEAAADRRLRRLAGWTPAPAF